MDIVFAAAMIAVVAFILFCLIAGTRRWRQAISANQAGLDLAREAVADRKKILAVLEDIRSLLQQQQVQGSWR